jgi:hypothetical protein
MLSDILEIKVIEENDVKMTEKEQLLNELEQIKNEFKEKIEKVQKQIEQENTKNDWWTPNNGEKYYFIASDGGVSISAYTDMSDIRKIDFLNCYKIKEQAERQSFEQLLHRKLQKFAFENNEEKFVNKQYKYSIIYNSLAKDNIKIEESLYCGSSFGQVYFTSKEIAEKAIEEFREDLIHYFTADK